MNVVASGPSLRDLPEFLSVLRRCSVSLHFTTPKESASIHTNTLTLTDRRRLSFWRVGCLPHFWSFLQLCSLWSSSSSQLSLVRRSFRILVPKGRPHPHRRYHPGENWYWSGDAAVPCGLLSSRRQRLTSGNLSYLIVWLASATPWDMKCFDNVAKGKGEDRKLTQNSQTPTIPSPSACCGGRGRERCGKLD